MESRWRARSSNENCSCFFIRIADLIAPVRRVWHSTQDPLRALCIIILGVINGSIAYIFRCSCRLSGFSLTFGQFDTLTQVFGKKKNVASFLICMSMTISSWDLKFAGGLSQMPQTWKCSPPIRLAFFAFFIVCQCWQPLIIFILGRCPATIRELPSYFWRSSGQRKQGKTAEANCLFKALRKIPVLWNLRLKVTAMLTSRSLKILLENGWILKTFKFKLNLIWIFEIICSKFLGQNQYCLKLVNISLVFSIYKFFMISELFSGHKSILK